MAIFKKKKKCISVTEEKKKTTSQLWKEVAATVFRDQFHAISWRCDRWLTVMAELRGLYSYTEICLFVFYSAFSLAQRHLPLLKLIHVWTLCGHVLPWCIYVKCIPAKEARDALGAQMVYLAPASIPLGTSNTKCRSDNQLLHCFR